MRLIGQFDHVVKMLVAVGLGVANVGPQSFHFLGELGQVLLRAVERRDRRLVFGQQVIALLAHVVALFFQLFLFALQLGQGLPFGDGFLGNVGFQSGLLVLEFLLVGLRRR